MKELQSDTSIVILPADKGKSIVIFNREVKWKNVFGKMYGSYKQGQYQLLEKDPTTKIKANLLKQNIDNEFIDNKLHCYRKPVYKLYCYLVRT